MRQHPYWQVERCSKKLYKNEKVFVFCLFVWLFFYPRKRMGQEVLGKRKEEIISARCLLLGGRRQGFLIFLWRVGESPCDRLSHWNWPENSSLIGSKCHCWESGNCNGVLVSCPGDKRLAWAFFLTQGIFTSQNSGGWEVQDRSPGRPGPIEGQIPGFQRATFLCFHGDKRDMIPLVCSLPRKLIPLKEALPYNLITSQCIHLQIPTLEDCGFKVWTWGEQKCSVHGIFYIPIGVQTALDWPICQVGECAFKIYPFHICKFTLKGRKHHKKIQRKKNLCVYKSPGRFAKKHIFLDLISRYSDGGAQETELFKNLRTIRSSSEVYAWWTTIGNYPVAISSHFIIEPKRVKD